MTTVAGPRYAPEDPTLTKPYPTLPKPWRGFVDGDTGYLYFWNPETNITRSERPGGNTNSGSSSCYSTMTTVAGPRYAPEDPTLPKPWRRLVDRKTGYLYSWNPETNIIRYERPGGNTNSGSAPQQKPSSIFISSSVQVQQSSQSQHRDNSYNDDDDRYNKSSYCGPKFASESRNYEGGSYMIHDAPDSYPLNDEKLISQQQSNIVVRFGFEALPNYLPPPPLEYEDEEKKFMTRLGKRAYEAHVAYRREVKESDGFDVYTRPIKFLPGGIKPVNLNSEDNRVKCVGLAKFAIEAFNTREKDSEGKLKFRSLVKATVFGGYVYLYYLTFTAENLVKRCIDTYQAVVKKPCRGENKVLAFRPKPQGSRPIEWYWDDRCRHKEETVIERSSSEEITKLSDDMTVIERSSSEGITKLSDDMTVIEKSSSEEITKLPDDV